MLLMTHIPALEHFPGPTHMFAAEQSAPVATAQVPLELARPHDWQAPHEGAEQQVLSTQLPEAQSLPSAQGVKPFILAPQLPLTQGFGARQSPSPPHELLHCWPSAVHLFGLQFVVAPPPVQAPAPLQVLASVATPFTHERDAHVVSAPYFVQPPAPSQRPLLPQVAASALPHRVAGSD